MSHCFIRSLVFSLGLFALGAVAQTLPLPGTLIDLLSPKGEQFLLEAKSHEAYFPISIAFVTQKSQAYCGVASMVMALAEGARLARATVDVKRVPETVPEEAAKAASFKLDQAAPIASIGELAEYDAIIVGTGTRFGRISSQMATFLDQAGGLWVRGACPRGIDDPSGIESPPCSCGMIPSRRPVAPRSALSCANTGPQAIDSVTRVSSRVEFI